MIDLCHWKVYLLVELTFLLHFKPWGNRLTFCLWKFGVSKSLMGFGAIARPLNMNIWLLNLKENGLKYQKMDEFPLNCSDSQAIFNDFWSTYRYISQSQYFANLFWEEPLASKLVNLSELLHFQWRKMSYDEISLVFIICIARIWALECLL